MKTQYASEDKIVWASLIPCVLFMVLNLIDMVSTGIAVQLLGVSGELNPVMRKAIQISPFLFVAVKMFIGLGVAFYADWQFRQKGGTNSLIWFVCGVYLSIAVIHIGSLTKY